MTLPAGSVWSYRCLFRRRLREKSACECDRWSLVCHWGEEGERESREGMRGWEYKGREGRGGNAWRLAEFCGEWRSIFHFRGSFCATTQTAASHWVSLVCLPLLKYVEQKRKKRTVQLHFPPSSSFFLCCSGRDPSRSRVSRETGVWEMKASFSLEKKYIKISEIFEKIWNTLVSWLGERGESGEGESA